jgi:type I restriction enzyme M protein
MTSSAIVQKLWNYCNVLRDDGMSYGDYVEQLTYLLFLKMADERTKPPYLPASGLTASELAQAGAGSQPPSIIPDKYSWPSLLKRDGDDLFVPVCAMHTDRCDLPESKHAGAQRGGISSD